jgi:uncharacterized membrane protein
MEESMGKNTLNTKKIALSGIMGALAVVCLLLAAILPTSTLAFYALSSFFISIIIIEFNSRAGLLFYLATSLLSVAIVPDKMAIVPYVLFFGLYGFVKFYIEKLNKLIPEYILKLLFFNICLAAAYFLVRYFFVENITSKLPWWVLIAGLEVVFVIYDYTYTLFIIYYSHRLKKILKT